LWIVPLVTRNSQRLGDIAAGTGVIVDKPEPISNLREVLSRKQAADARFVFDNATLKRARPEDFHAVERTLERWGLLNDAQREAFLSQLVPALAGRIQTEAPADTERLQFLADLLAAEYRRQHRSLG
jgi:hypothetical protein